MEPKIAIIGTILLIIINSAFFINYDDSLTDLKAQASNQTFDPVFYLQLKKDNAVKVVKNETKKKQPKKEDTQEEAPQQIVAYNPLPPSPTPLVVQDTGDQETVDPPVESPKKEDNTSKPKQKPEEPEEPEEPEKPEDPVEPEEPEPIVDVAPFDMGGHGG